MTPSWETAPTVERVCPRKRRRPRLHRFYVKHRPPRRKVHAPWKKAAA